MKFDISMSHRIRNLDDLVSYVEILARELNKAVGAENLHVYHISIWTKSMNSVSVSFWSGEQDYFGSFTCTATSAGWVATDDSGDEIDKPIEYLTDMYTAVCAATRMSARYD